MAGPGGPPTPIEGTTMHSDTTRGVLRSDGTGLANQSVTLEQRGFGTRMWTRGATAHDTSQSGVVTVTVA